MGIFYGNSTSQSNLLADIWRSTTSHQGNTTPLVNWERPDTGNQGYVAGMSESSGVFSFPKTGLYLVQFFAQMYLHNSTATSQRNTAGIQLTTNNSSFSTASQGHVHFGGGGYSTSIDTQATSACAIIFDITDTGNQKVRFFFGAGQGGEYVRGDSSTNETYATFQLLGDT
jgi:hypothetical protein